MTNRPLPRTLTRATHGITYNPSTQSSLDRTSAGPSRARNESSQYGASAGATREWGSRAHEMFLRSTNKRKELEAAAQRQRELKRAAELSLQQQQEIMNTAARNAQQSGYGQLGSNPTQGGKRPMKKGQTGLPDSGINYGPTAFRKEIIERAKNYLGVPYTLGGGHQKNALTPSKGWNGIWGLDCSGLTGIVYRQMGINLPGLSNAQTAYGRKTNISNARPGDLVGWNRGGHVGIYIGNGQILHAPQPGKTVEIRNIFRGEAIYAVQLTLPGDKR